MEIKSKFDLPREFTEKKFFDDLNTDYRVHRDPTRTFTTTYYDTFDWRLYNKGLTLFHAENRISLCRLNDFQPTDNLTCKTPPVLISDLSESPLKKLLSPILDVRALLRLFETRSYLTTFGILDELEKTVVRLSYERIELQKGRSHVSLGSQISICPVKGYDESASKLEVWLLEKEFKPSGNSIYLQALDLLKRRPGDYCAKPDIPLAPETRSDVATKLILGYLLGVIRRNEDGIKKDIDTEFLHDFRVAVRRTRSALSQIKAVFPPNVTEQFKQSFSYLGKLTNRLRDLDVYLLHQYDYRTMLPAAFKGDIDPLFTYLQEERQKEFRKVVRGLNSEKYRRILREWEIFLQEAPGQRGLPKNAKMPVIKLACSRIRKRYRKVIRLGKHINEESPDHRLHELRIECKKLRYLMEFFSSLFVHRKMKGLVRQLKKLQDNLGRFQDLFIQEQALQGFVAKLPCDTIPSRRTAMAIGSLIDRLDLEKQQVRKMFYSIFTEFSSATNKNQFRKLFVRPAKKES